MNVNVSLPSNLTIRLSFFLVKSEVIGAISSDRSLQLLAVRPGWSRS